MFPLFTTRQFVYTELLANEITEIEIASEVEATRTQSSPHLTHLAPYLASCVGISCGVWPGASTGTL